MCRGFSSEISVFICANSPEQDASVITSVFTKISDAPLIDIVDVQLHPLPSTISTKYSPSSKFVKLKSGPSENTPVTFSSTSEKPFISKVSENVKSGKL